jgi:cysteine desulfuration protein SufE
MTIEQTQQQIIDEFSMFDDWMDKYNFLIEMGKDCPIIDTQYKTNNYLITGCQSRVWLHASYDGNLISFSADSDAVITKGIVNLLIRVFNGHSPEEILAADTAFLDQIGLKEHLSPTRSNGLVSMVKQMKLYAQVYHLKSTQQTKHE